MTTTITRDNKSANAPSKNVDNTPSNLSIVAKTEEKCHGKSNCENCRNKKLKATTKKKSKPMYKLGCWRGAFKGTLDF